MVALKMVVLILSLGADTLMMSVALGFVQTKGIVKIALTFACAEAIMPLVGLLIGHTAGRLIGDWASLVGGIILLGVAAWFIFFEDEDEEEEKLERTLEGWTLILTALSISLDELAVGFSIGLVGVPITLTLVLIALQAFVFTFIGLRFGSSLKRYLGEWSEKLAGVVLALLGIWILMDAAFQLTHH
ncbi:manganese efflux pump MntP family protein [Alicyclobacillus tolerans]|uniref:manganese efflux pump MntP n=1 Tax=Alicyclobacillus tolerans TaxID=90970 RepID=UPI001F377DEE|nr:manganese efflux pump [Alicyclobacillus tolerans]MCF8563197.1 manganese efflux pump MntP family protein [Alicyclobacillus tolerans]